MKILVAFAVLFLISAQVFAEEIGANDDLNYWSDWSDTDQLKEELPLPLEHFLQRIARRPRPQQFYGLMGKRDAGYGQISHKIPPLAVVEFWSRRQSDRGSIYHVYTRRDKSIPDRSITTRRSSGSGAALSLYVLVCAELASDDEPGELSEGQKRGLTKGFFQDEVPTEYGF
ncbi:Protachykinin-1 [Chelonia mydas]|uniref:Protachykinin-1 n=1 Tax=Chelonia mydas TaxID=8469 RepID=M7C0N9_CHEMY|nr:Protachykinin-1 [Chelonia mydas]